MKVLSYVICLSIVLLNFIPATNGQEEYYSSRYDSLDVDALFKSRLLNNYVDCLLDRKPCPPEGKDLKRVLPDALRTRCGQCTKIQKTKALDVITRLYYQHPRLYTALAARYDPTGEYTKNFENWFDEQNAVKPRPSDTIDNSRTTRIPSTWITTQTARITSRPTPRSTFRTLRTSVRTTTQPQFRGNPIPTASLAAQTNPRRIETTTRFICIDGSTDPRCPPNCFINPNDLRCPRPTTTPRRIETTSRFVCFDGSTDSRCPPNCFVNPFDPRCPRPTTTQPTTTTRRIETTTRFICTEGSTDPRCPPNCVTNPYDERCPRSTTTTTLRTLPPTTTTERPSVVPITQPTFIQRSPATTVKLESPSILVELPKAEAPSSIRTIKEESSGFICQPRSIDQRCPPDCYPGSRDFRCPKATTTTTTSTTSETPSTSSSISYRILPVSVRPSSASEPSFNQPTNVANKETFKPSTKASETSFRVSPTTSVITEPSFNQPTNANTKETVRPPPKASVTPIRVPPPVTVRTSVITEPPFRRTTKIFTPPPTPRLRIPFLPAIQRRPIEQQQPQPDFQPSLIDNFFIPNGNRPFRRSIDRIISRTGEVVNNVAGMVRSTVKVIAG
ncbi:CLUMA_CG015020, isoform A [Clunio marinus]|uniref:CLUMA_CG015020, isoform A n=1 Tax=Clunio marinus TaxID=568069 RepID=A0A1J1IQI2_9DIPT|nr:CLUMA_CG015020, isoform A [Clunio marinus]